MRAPSLASTEGTISEGDRAVRPVQARIVSDLERGGRFGVDRRGEIDPVTDLRFGAGVHPQFLVRLVAERHVDCIISHLGMDLVIRYEASNEQRLYP